MPRKKEVCIRCKKKRFVNKRTEDGPICAACYSRKRRADSSMHEICIECGEKRFVEERTEDGPVCTLCCRKKPRFDRPASEAHTGNEETPSAVKQPKQVLTEEQCAVCKNFRRVYKRTKHGKPICVSCAARGYGYHTQV